MLEAAIAKTPRDPQLQARRAHLAEQIREANVALEVAIEVEDRTIRQIEVERREVGFGTGTSTIEQELIATASDALAMAVRIWNGKLNTAGNRLSAVEDQILHSGRRDPWAMALLADAQSELKRAQEMSEAAWRAAITEP